MKPKWKIRRKKIPRYVVRKIRYVNFEKMLMDTIIYDNEYFLMRFKVLRKQKTRENANIEENRDSQ